MTAEYNAGEAKGREEKAQEIAKNLLEIKLPIEQIAQASGLSIDEIKALKN